MHPTSGEFWIALLQIIGIDIVLSGDNAVVIALACRSLPREQQRWGIALGTLGAIGLRVVFAAFIISLLAIPYLKLVGGALLLWIAVKLLMPEQEGEGEGITARATLFAAVRTIIVADAVMSLDNVIGIAAAAKGDLLLLVLGLLVSIPLIVFGSTLILRLLGRYPMIVTFGGALLGWVAGGVIVHDPALTQWLTANAEWLISAAPPVSAVAVVLLGRWLAARRSSALHEVRLDDRGRGDE